MKSSLLGAVLFAFVASAAQAQGLDHRLLRCMAHIVYGEARDEPLVGQYAVAWSLVFRAWANQAYWGGADICNVAYKRRMRADGTEGWEYDGANFPVTDMDAWRESLEVAYWTLMGEGRPNLPVTYFCAPSSCRKWHDVTAKLAHVGTIGGHKFYVDWQLSGLGTIEASGR